MSSLPLHHMSVFLAALLQWVIGAVWYSPFLYGPQWKTVVTVPPEHKRTRMIAGMIVSFIGNLVTAMLLKHIIWWTGWGGLKRGVLVGCLLWAGFIFAPLFAQYIYEGRSFKLFAINTGYWLVALAASAAFLARY